MSRRAPSRYKKRVGFRWFWRLLSATSPWMGVLLVVLGTVTVGLELREVASVGRVRVATGNYVIPGVALAFGALFLLFCVYDRRAERRLADDKDDDDAEERGRSSPTSPAKPSRIDRLLQARDFLPDEPPEGWSRPLAVAGSNRWMFDTKTETVALVLERQRWMMAVKVFIAGRGMVEPVSDARCADILAHMRRVGEFIEIDPDEDHPGVRMWLAVPTGLRPRWRVPKSVPPPRERLLSPHLVAARKYLPQRLPQGWSVPIAIGDDHGTEWKDGAWMIGTSDPWFIVVFLVTSKGRVKLSVTFFGADGHEVSEGSAAEMLRHFRGVLEFAQTEATEGSPDAIPTRTYLGEIAPEGRSRVLLN